MKTVLLCMTSLALPVSAATLVDFNAPGALGMFTVEGGSTGVATQQDGAGFNGTGGISITSVTRTHAFVYPESFGGTTAAWYTSVLFKPGHASSKEFGLGFATGQNIQLSDLYPTSEADTPDLANVLGSIHTNFTATGIELRASETGTSATELGVAFSPLSVGTWYQAALAVIHNGGTNYTARASIFSLDAGGNPGSEIVFTTATFENASLAADSSVYNYLAVANNTGGTLDNFTTHVPEPASALLGALAGAVFVTRRRR